MDFGLITGLASTLKTTYDLGNSALQMRDSYKVTTALAEINDQLLKAQQSLFVVSGQAFELLQKLSAAEEKNRKLEASAQERARYALVKFQLGHFAYGVKKAHAVDGAEPADTEPVHYLCQPCFDSGRKAVLQADFIMGIANGLSCPLCKEQVFD